MIPIAAFKFRNVLAEHGGPVAAIDCRPFDVRGRAMQIANASLDNGLARRQPTALYGQVADGTGVDRDSVVARHKAVSEALERWAFSQLVRSERAAEYGFDIDPTTCGMAAFPGMFAKDARRRAVLEAIERFCIMGWWEGRLPGRHFDTDWPGIAAVAIDGPFGGITAIVYAKTAWGDYAYGHAADVSFSGAVERAIVELARHENLLRSAWLRRTAGHRIQAVHLLERRALFFGSAEGFALFEQRMRNGVCGAAPHPDVICDAELFGPWSEYATVWRYALRPPSDGHVRGGERYFFL